MIYNLSAQGLATMTPNPHCIMQQVNPRMLFATHYHTLNAETAGDPHIQQGHMAALVGAQRDTGAAAVAGGGAGSGPGSSGGDGITFLYQLRQGPCDKSYGLLVSNMPAELLLDALQPAGQAQCWYSTPASAASVRARRVGTQGRGVLSNPINS
jgi:DNA mismatch repair ATPase MutS